MNSNRTLRLISLFPLLAASMAQAAGVRDFTRMAPDTAVSDVQASELTLTLTDAAMRPIQNWVRTSGTLDKSGRVLTAFIRSPEAELIKTGQRANAFTVNTRTRMTLGRVTGIQKQPGGAFIETTLPAALKNDGTRFLMEIVVERGPYLSIPNVSIIEEGDQHVVYVQKEAGRYTPQVIKTGLQGELYTQVTEGLSEGDQVVSVGSFFVDADNKLKSAGMAAMPGMDHSAMTQSAANAPAGAGPQAIMSDPEPNAAVKAPLYMIHVMFNNPVDVKTARMNITDKSGKSVDVGEAIPMGDDGKMLMAMPKIPLPAGSYNVKWQVAGTDGKQLQGEFAFTAQ
jgi:methionine-rich copper-binding protein CopC